MTDQLERDLTELFAQRAAVTDVPPIPRELFAGDERPGARRRTVVAVVVAAAAVAAVAVPVGLALRDGDVASIEVPYLRDGHLHVGDVAVPTDATTIAGAGDHVYVGTAEGTWERLDGETLEPAPYLDGSRGVFVSPDGRRVAALVGDGQTTVALMDAEYPSDVSTHTLAEPAGEDPWVFGFDTANRLFLQDGSELLMKELTGDEVTVRRGDRLFAGMAPLGPVMVGPSGAGIATIADDGRVTDWHAVPVSTAGVWNDDSRLAYAEGPGLRVVLPQAGAQPKELMTDTEGTVQPLGWSGGRVVAQEWLPGAGSRVVLVSPDTGEVDELFTVAEGDDSVAFPPVSGTGAL
jgi:hypothetical protein